MSSKLQKLMLDFSTGFNLIIKFVSLRNNFPFTQSECVFWKVFGCQKPILWLANKSFDWLEGYVGLFCATHRLARAALVRGNIHSEFQWSMVVLNWPQRALLSFLFGAFVYVSFRSVVCTVYLFLTALYAIYYSFFTVELELKKKILLWHDWL